MKGTGQMDENRRATALYLALVWGFSYGLGALELLLKNGVCYDLLAGGFTFVPVLSALLVRRITGGKRGGHVSLKVLKRPGALAFSALVPGVLIALGAALYFLVFPEQYSGVLRLSVGLKPVEIGHVPLLIPAAILLSALCVPVHLLELGEEAGWRGYLLFKQVERYGAPQGGAAQWA